MLTCSAFVAAGCGGEAGQEDLLSAEERTAAESLSPLPEVPADPTNRLADDPEAAELGQKLFFETRYSGPLQIGDDGMNGALGEEGDTQKVSCAGCHIPDSYFSDNRSQPGNVSLGVKFTPRNTPSLVNVAFYEWYGWGGKQDRQWTQSSLSPESGSNSAGNRCDYAHMVWEHYKDEYEAVTGDPLPEALDPSASDAERFPASCKPKKADSDPDGAWEQMAPEDQDAVNLIMANCGKAVAAYERLLVSRDSPFDRFIAGESDAISRSAQRGLKLFVGKAGCVDCHEGPNFTDNDFHNTGVSQAAPNAPDVDTGRYDDLDKAKAHTFNSASEYSDDQAFGQERLSDLSATDSDLGAFRTKALRNVAETAPYFHNGSAETLREVIEFYNRGGDTDGFVGDPDARMVPLNLSQQEIDDLVAFLRSLTGEPVPDALRQDTSAP